MKAICSVCGMDRECRTITIENGEGAALGLDDGTQFHYCKPCWGILQDRQAAASLLQGQTTKLLRALGHPMPHHAAQRLHDLVMGKLKV